MTYEIWVYQDAPGRIEFYEWRSNHLRRCKAQIAKMEEKLDKLQLVGKELFPQILTGTEAAGILKLRIHGNPQLRPLLCYGPHSIETEFTLLLGAKEVSFNYDPRDALAKASTNKGNVIADQLMRVEYESF